MVAVQHEIATQKESRRQRQRISLAVVTLVPVAHVVALLAIIWTIRSRAPFWDEWTTVSLIRSFDAGDLTWSQLWAFHNEHRIVVPRLIDLTLIELTRWNRQIEMTFDLLVAVGSSVLFMNSARRVVSDGKAIRILVVAFSVLLFSGGQYENWFWPFQIQFIVTVFGIACCVWALSAERVGHMQFSVAVFGAFLGSFSGFSGLIVWYAFVPSLYRRAGPIRTLLWFLLSLAVVGFYLQGFDKTTAGVPGLLNIIEYSLAYLGAPIGLGFVPSSEVCALIGASLFLTNGVTLWRAGYWDDRLIPWIDLTSFAILSAVVTSLGRGAYGIGQAMASRYEIFSALAWLGLVVISVVLFDRVRNAHGPITLRHRVVRLLNYTFVPVLACLLVASSLVGLAVGIGAQKRQVETQRCVIHFRTASKNCLANFYASPHYIRVQAAYLARRRLAIFDAETATNRK